MTREQAIIRIKGLYGNGYAEQEQALDMAIKALEQEPVFNKIRTEIDRQEKWLLQAGYTTYNVDIAFNAIKAVLAESENKKCI